MENQKFKNNKFNKNNKNIVVNNSQSSYNRNIINNFNFNNNNQGPILLSGNQNNDEIVDPKKFNFSLKIYKCAYYLFYFEKSLKLKMNINSISNDSLFLIDKGWFNYFKTKCKYWIKFLINFFFIFYIYWIIDNAIVIIIFF